MVSNVLCMVQEAELLSHYVWLINNKSSARTSFVRFLHHVDSKLVDQRNWRKLEDAMTNENTDSTANPVAPPSPVGNPMAAYFWENQASIDAHQQSFDASADHDACQARDKIKITYERYQTVSRAIIMHLRKQEAGLSKQDIIDWHVSAQTEIADHGREGEVRVVRSVLKNMLHTDHSLETANDVGGGGEPIYTVHPQYIVTEQ